jgi:hypothetical protein
MVKSACWECRKRKAKCNGQKPLCSTCTKFDTECVYDSDVRESRVRNLQDANEKLENELEAANLLLRQVASGNDELRSLVLQYMDAGKQPLHIVRALSNSEELDAQSFRGEGTRDESIAFLFSSM